VFTKENQQISNIKRKKKEEDQIRSNQDLIRLIEIGVGMLGGHLLCDRCDGGIGASREIGETVRRGGSVWLGLAGHELGERESEQREKEREQRLGRGAGGGSGQ
jgi:hypothetical protein